MGERGDAGSDGSKGRRHSNRDGRALKKTWNWLMHLPATWSGVGLGDADGYGSALWWTRLGWVCGGIFCWWYVNSFKWIALYADFRLCFGSVSGLLLFQSMCFSSFSRRLGDPRPRPQLIFGQSCIFWRAYYCYNNDVQKHLCHLKGHSCCPRGKGELKGKAEGRENRLGCAVRFRSFFPKCFSLYAIKALAFFAFNWIVKRSAQNLINFHYNFVDFMVRSSTARFPISLLRRFVEQINLMAWQFSWVALSLARTQAFLFIIGLKDEGCKTQTQTDIYIYYKSVCVCVLLLLQKTLPTTNNK